MPDIEPGLASKTLARFADRICVTSPRTQQYLTSIRGRHRISSPQPISSRWTKQEGRLALGLDGDLPVLLVAGGSKGARSINEALIAHLPALLEVAQVVHLTGQGELEAVAAATSRLSPAAADSIPSLRVSRTRTWGPRSAAADFAVMRAGASVLGRAPALRPARHPRALSARLALPMGQCEVPRGAKRGRGH